MALLSWEPNELQDIKELLGLKSLEIFVSTDWGSQKDNHRDLIHEHLKRRQQKAYPLFDSSISHTMLVGGFIFAEFDHQDMMQIGFDMESSERITPKIAQRIAKSETEWNFAPSPQSFWVAKEAAYKSLKGPQQPIVISNIELSPWTKPMSQFETVRVQNVDSFSSKNIQGIVFKKVVLNISHHFSIFVARP